MADVNANIGVNIDTSAALSQLKDLQRQISLFHSSISKSSETAALAQRDLQRNFLNSVNALGAFSAELRTVKTTSESFTSSLEKNKFSMREYFRYAGASTKTFGKLFKSEYDTIGKVAEDRVKKLQTQYIKMGRDATGAMKAIAIIPNELDMGNFATQTQIAAQKQALFNQLMRQGSTNLLNFGKNTQWAGRQLMVGFTLPLMAAGSAASKSFMQMEAQALKFKKVYGDLFTPQAETEQALANVQELAKQFTKYGIAVADTVGLAADAAAAGFQGVDLQRQTTEATRLSVLGQIDNQQALSTTIALQNAFGISSAELADNINFLNAVENQTVVSLDDITTAIPKVAPVIQQLGGNVKDLAFFLTAMKEGGINASEGANALKSGLASLINPSTRAREMLSGLGVDINAIVNNNKGDLKATVVGFAQALDTLAPLERARAIEQMFGKFQFARLSALFANVTKDGTQASRVLKLAGASVEELATLSEQELGKTADSSMNKFKKSVEDLKAAIVPVGEAFLKTVTPIIDFISGIAEKFSNLSDGTKKAITVMVTVIGGLGPILLMTFGLLANGVANIIKLFLTLRTGYQNLTGQSQNLGEQTQYFTSEQIDAAAAAHSLNQAHATLTQQFTVEATELQKLIAVYQAATTAAARFAGVNPGMMIPPKTKKKFAKGGIIRGPGTGKSDSIPIMASNGEAIIDAETVNNNQDAINSLIKTGQFVPKTYVGGPSSSVLNTNPDQVNRLKAGLPGVPQRSPEEIAERVAQQLAKIESAKARRMGMMQPTVSAPVTSSVSEEFISTRVGRNASGGEKAQVNIPGGYQLGHFAEPIQKTGAELRALVGKEAKGVKDAVEKLIASAGGNLETIFDVFTNQITVQSKELNQALGEVGSGKTADVNMFRKESVSQAGAYNSPLIREMQKAGATTTEVELAVKQLAKEFSDGIDDIVKGTTVTAEQVNEITKTAYDKVAATNEKVKQAQMALEKPGAIKEVTGVTSGRVSFAGGYNTSTVKKGINEVVQKQAPGLYPTQQAFNFTGEAARKVGIQNAKAIRLVFDQLGQEAKTRVFALVGDIDAMSKQVIAEAQSAGIDIGKYAVRGVAKGAETESPSKATRRTGEDVGKGLEAGIKSREDDVARAGESIGKVATNSTDRGARRVATRAQGAPLSQVSAQLISAPQTEQEVKKFGDSLKQTTPRIARMNSALQGGSFALMSLSGMAQMFGGTLGQVSNVIFNVSGALFALQTITQLLTSAKLLELAATRANNVAVAMGAANFKKLFATVVGFGSRLLTAGKFLARFAGIPGLIISGIIGTGSLIKISNDARKREYIAINGLADAMAITTNQVKTLGDFFGIVPSKLPFELGKGREIASPQARSQRESLKTNEGFQKQFGQTIQTLSKSTASEAQLAFTSLALNLKAQGFATEQVQTIIDTLREEAGKTDVVLDVKSLNLSTESLDKLKTQIAPTIISLNKELKNMETQSARSFATGEIVSWVNISKKAQKELATLSSFMSESAKSAAGMFQLGLIDATTYTNTLNSVIGMTNGLDEANRKLLLTKVFESLGTGAGALIANLKSARQEMMAFALLSSGVLDKDSSIFKALGSKDARTRGRGVAQLTKQYNALTDAVTKVTEQTDQKGGVTGGGGVSSDVLSKEAKLTIARLQKELDGLKTKRDLINEANDGLKRQYEYQQKLMQLSQDATQAKISGNYIGASMLEQQKLFTTGQFNKETDSIALDKIITRLENKISALQAGERVSAADRALLKAKSKGKAMGGLIKGPGTGRSDSILAGFAMGGLPQLTVSNGEYIVQSKAVQSYGVGFMDALNNQKVGVSNSTTSSGSTVYNIDMTINGGNQNPSDIADQVIKRLKVETSKNNKSNKVAF